MKFKLPNKVSLTDACLIVTLLLVAFAPSAVSAISFGLSLLNYNAKRFGHFHYQKADEAQLNRLKRVEDELKAVISAQELRKMSR